MSLQKAVSFGLACLPLSRGASRFSKLDRGRAEDMLHTVSDEVRKYDDPKLHGLDGSKVVCL
jgi:hypothetical protein